MTKKFPLASPMLFRGLLSLALVLAALMAACEEGQTDLPVSPDVQQAAATAVAEGDRSALERLAPTAAYEATQTASRQTAGRPESTKDTAPSPIPPTVEPSPISPTVEGSTTPPSVEEPTPTPGPTPIPPSDTTPETDRQALASLYQAAKGDNWTNKDGWLSEKPLGKWYGVSADGNGRVTSLSLTNNNLNGRLPSELGNLSNLQTLSLSNNPELTGNLPPQLGNLVNLEKLDLSNNPRLTGELPEEIAALDNLGKLVLTNTEVCVPTELEEIVLPKIRYAWNYSYVYAGRLCREMETLTAIHEALGGDQWTSKDGWLSEKPLREWYGVNADSEGRVIRLDLSQNGLTGNLPPQLGNLVNLETLDLRNNPGLTGNLPAELGNLTNLETLRLSNNPELTGNLPPQLGNLVNLETLDLRNNPGLTGILPPAIGNLPKLRYLPLTNTNVCIPQELEETIGTRVLDTSGPTYGYTTGRLCREMETLGAIYKALGGDQWTNKDGWLTEKPLHQWAGVGTEQHGRVTSLNLNQNGLTGNLPPQLGNLVNLEALHVFNNPGLTGELPPALANLVNLETLDLRNNPGLTGILPPAIVNLPKLRYLPLTNTNVCIPQELEETIGTKVLDTSGPTYGYTTGRLCREMETLSVIYKALGGDQWTNKDGWLTEKPLHQWAGVGTERHGRVTRLNLNQNGLTGNLPPQLGNLVNLEALHIFNNPGLTGELPPELANLVNLEALDLRNNPSLTGCVPISLQSRLTSVWLDEAQSCAGDTPPARVGQPAPGTPTTPGTDPVPPVTVQPSPGTKPAPPEPDRLALVAFYNATDGPSWTRAFNWLSDEPLEDWHGVDTDGNGRVTHLRLGNNGLSGRVPPELGRLAYLRELRLNDNLLKGTMPPELGRLFHIRSLNLSNNVLTGQIPDTLGDLRGLTYLTLGGNRLYLSTGFRPVGCIPAGLQDVSSHDLHTLNVPFCDRHPEERAALVSLYNAVGGPADRDLLVDLYYSCCLPVAVQDRIDFRSDDPEVDIEDWWLEYIEGVPEDNDLVQQYRGLAGWFRKGGWNTDAPLSEWDGVTVGGEGRVIGLGLNNNNLAGSMTGLWDLPSLQTLRLEGNNYLRGCIPLYMQERLVSLSGLDFCLSEIERLRASQWETLVAFYNAAGGKGWTTGWNVEDKTANVGQWHGVTVDERTGLVTKLELPDNNLHENIPAAVGDLSALTHLDLSGNRLGGAIPPQLDLLTNLVHLDLSGNALRGHVDKKTDGHPRRIEWKNLNNLSYLDLSDNKDCGRLGCRHGLSGSVYIFSCMDKLNHLNLSNNEFTYGATGMLDNPCSEANEEETIRIDLRGNPWSIEPAGYRPYYNDFVADMERGFVDLAILAAGQKLPFTDVSSFQDYLRDKGIEEFSKGRVLHHVNPGRWRNAVTLLVDLGKAYGKVSNVVGWVSLAADATFIIIDMIQKGITFLNEGPGKLIERTSDRVLGDWWSCALEHGLENAPTYKINAVCGEW